MSELQMQQKIAEILRRQGFNVYLEVPFLSRSIDIVAVKGSEIYALELKLNDWRKAITQSSDHLHGADKSFVCIPLKTRINEELLNLVQEAGLGLMFYDEEKDSVEEIMPAQESEQVWPPARQWLASAIGVVA